MSPGKESGRETNVRFGILGTGVVGETIASRLDDMAHEVTVGTRDPEEPASRAEPGTYGNPIQRLARGTLQGQARCVRRSGRPR
jgi:predicted dinucleotide-binding enzyme